MNNIFCVELFFIVEIVFVFFVGVNKIVDINVVFDSKFGYFCFNGFYDIGYFMFGYYGEDVFVLFIECIMDI